MKTRLQFSFVFHDFSKDDLKVPVGAHSSCKWDTKNAISSVKNIFPHPNYIKETNFADIMLVKLIMRQMIARRCERKFVSVRKAWGFLLLIFHCRQTLQQKSRSFMNEISRSSDVQRYINVTGQTWVLYQESWTCYSQVLRYCFSNGWIKYTSRICSSFIIIFSHVYCKLTNVKKHFAYKYFAILLNIFIYSSIMYI